MNVFVKKILFFSVLLSCLLFISLMYLPNNLRSTMLGEMEAKRRMLSEQPSPRLIFVGGSNLSYGLNSEQISKQFNLPVVNMGLHAALGLSYMLDEVSPFVRQGDRIVLVPEYHQFGHLFYGNMELIAVLFDLHPEDRTKIPLGQWMRLLKFMPNYAATKLVPFFRLSLNKYCSKYNSYGDYTGHWGEGKPPSPTVLKSERIKMREDAALKKISTFMADVQRKGAQVFLLPPCYQKSAFENSREVVEALRLRFEEFGFRFESDPERYAFDDSLFFDTAYHLNKEGVDRRTFLVIEDLTKLLAR
jgi:hypothetical protein